MRDAVEENDKEENRNGLYSEKYPFCTLTKNASFVYLIKHSGLESAVLHHDKSETHRM